MEASSSMEVGLLTLRLLRLLMPRGKPMALKIERVGQFVRDIQGGRRGGLTCWPSGDIDRERARRNKKRQKKRGKCPMQHWVGKKQKNK